MTTTYVRSYTDFGNSNTKSKINDWLVIQPSVIQQNYDKLPPSDQPLESQIHSLADNFVATISSPSIKTSGTYYVGKRANLNPTKAQNMSISLGNKYKHDIPVIMDLSLTAIYAITQYYKTHKELPSLINVKKELTGAIPASEFRQEENNEALAKIMERRFTGTDTNNPINHILTVPIAGNAIQVSITYNNVKITQEGVPALFAILESIPRPSIQDPKINIDILSKFKETYKDDPIRLKLAVRELLSLKVLIIDIGAGTTEFVHFENWNPIRDNCDGKKLGVGHAAENALRMFNKEFPHSPINRQRFDSILLDPTNRFYDVASTFMMDTIRGQSDLLLQEIEETYNRLSGDIDLFIVLGGGSITFEETLYNHLVSFANHVLSMVLWIPAEFAVNLNVEGLEIMHKNIFFKDSEFAKLIEQSVEGLTETTSKKVVNKAPTRRKTTQTQKEEG